MSNRERWVVYPLLFLALGASLRPAFFPSARLAAGQMRAQVVQGGILRCKELVLEGPDSQEMLVARCRPLGDMGTIPVLQTRAAVMVVADADPQQAGKERGMWWMLTPRGVLIPKGAAAAEENPPGAPPASEKPQSPDAAGDKQPATDLPAQAGESAL